MLKTPNKWQILVAAILIAVTAALAIGHLFNLSSDHLQAETRLAQVTGLAHRLSAIEWQAAAEGRWKPEQARLAEETASELKEILESLPGWTHDQESFGRLRSVVNQYEQDVRSLSKLYRTGRFAEARHWDETHVDRSYDALLDALADTSAESAEKAKAWDTWAQVGILGTLLTSAVLSAMLFLRFEKARRAAARLEAEQRTLGKSERRLSALVQNASDVFAILDGEGIFRYISTACERVLGYAPMDLIDSSAMAIVHSDDRALTQDLLQQAVAAPGRSTAAELRLKQGDGSWGDYEVIACDLMNVPEVNGVVITYRKITERKAAQRELTRLAFEDVLTGLPNRARFMNRLTYSLTLTDIQPNSVAILFIDLDNFKLINDSLGHEMGDHLLVAVAQRLQECLASQHMVARLGGDEFTILLEETSLSEALRLAEQLRMHLLPPFHLQGQELYVTASIGVAINDAGCGRAECLLQNADLAMYHAKRSGKDRQVAFDVEMRNHVDQRLATETALRRAIERGELRLFYQPIVLLATGAIVGVEALLRWDHPYRGLIAPTEFIPVAEETGLIVDLGRWVLNEACRQVQSWQTLRPDQAPLRLSVNLSASQFQHPRLVKEVMHALEASGLDPLCLELELTESALMHDMDGSVAVLRELKDLGIRTAVDDFGTGYSSLAYLQRFPLNTLKIDRSFTSLVGADPKIMAIVTAVVQMGRDLGLDVVCEGIEHSGQLEYLKGIRCPLGQGYHFARPLPPADCGEFLRVGRLVG